MDDRKKQPYDALGKYAPIDGMRTDDDYIRRGAAIKCCTLGRTSLGLTSELRRLPAADVIPVDWILNYATEVDKDGSVVFSRNHIDTMLEEWRSQQ